MRLRNLDARAEIGQALQRAIGEVGIQALPIRTSSSRDDRTERPIYSLRNLRNAMFICLIDVNASVVHYVSKFRSYPVFVNRITGRGSRSAATRHGTNCSSHAS